MGTRLKLADGADVIRDCQDSLVARSRHVDFHRVCIRDRTVVRAKHLAQLPPTQFSCFSQMLR